VLLYSEKKQAFPPHLCTDTCSPATLHTCAADAMLVSGQHPLRHAALRNPATLRYIQSRAQCCEQNRVPWRLPAALYKTLVLAVTSPSSDVDTRTQPGRAGKMTLTDARAVRARLRNRARGAPARA